MKILKFLFIDRFSRFDLIGLLIIISKSPNIWVILGALVLLGLISGIFTSIVKTLEKDDEKSN